MLSAILFSLFKSDFNTTIFGSVRTFDDLTEGIPLKLKIGSHCVVSQDANKSESQRKSNAASKLNANENHLIDVTL